MLHCFPLSKHIPHESSFNLSVNGLRFFTSIDTNVLYTIQKAHMSVIRHIISQCHLEILLCITRKRLTENIYGKQQAKLQLFSGHSAYIMRHTARDMPPPVSLPQQVKRRPESPPGPAACVCGGHLWGCEKILTLRKPSDRGRRRASRPEPEEH